jgi:hypothetical protein
MQRPILYVLALFLHTGFWLVLLLTNYTEYTSTAPEMLDQEYFQQFEENRVQLVLAELLFPAVMAICSIVLLFIKFRPAPVRLPFLILLLMGVEFWLWRWLFFPDRMATYYALNSGEFFPTDVSQGHEVILAGYSIFFMLILLFREYTQPENPLDVALEQLKQRIRRGQNPHEKPIEERPPWQNIDSAAAENQDPRP